MNFRLLVNQIHATRSMKMAFWNFESPGRVEEFTPSSSQPAGQVEGFTPPSGMKGANIHLPVKVEVDIDTASTFSMISE